MLPACHPERSEGSAFTPPFASLFQFLVSGFQESMRRKNRDAPEWIQSQKVHVSGHDVRFPSTHRQFEELVVLGITACFDPFLPIRPFRLARPGRGKASLSFM